MPDLNRRLFLSRLTGLAALPAAAWAEAPASASAPALLLAQDAPVGIDRCVIAASATAPRQRNDLVLAIQPLRLLKTARTRIKNLIQDDGVSRETVQARLRHQ